jgi:hypothetical protein
MKYAATFLGAVGGASVMWAVFVALENKGSAATLFLALAGIAAIYTSLFLSKEPRI